MHFCYPVQAIPRFVCESVDSLVVFVFSFDDSGSIDLLLLLLNFSITVVWTLSEVLEDSWLVSFADGC